MNDPTRRGFLAATGAGAATVATVALAGPAQAAITRSARAATTSADGKADLSAAGDGPLVAYVNDVSSGRITLVAGEQRAVVTDHSLARSLARRTGRS